MKRFQTKEEIMQSFDLISSEIIQSLELLNTSQKVKTVTKKRGLYMEPSKFVVKKEVFEKLGVFKDKEYTGSIMPIEHEIKGFLERPGVLDAILENQQNMLNSSYPNLINGEIGKTVLKNNVDRNVVFVSIYQDDFNPDNSLSPHATNTKLSSYYYGFPTLPVHHSVNVDNIFLAAVHKTKDVENSEVLSHGVDPGIFAIWEAFSPLEENGFELEIEGNTIKVYLAVAQMFGDNLGLNTNFGFNRGFTGGYSCRICEVHKDEMEISVETRQDLIRTESSFNECLQGLSNVEKKGVKYDSWLNMFRYFKVYNNHSVDIMHDVFLGVFKYDLIAVLNYYIKNKTFSLQEFNRQKKKFDYGKKDKGNISVDITETHLENKLKINAKEMWTLIEYLPLILFFLLRNPQRCKVFKFVLQMEDVLDKITKKQYREQDIQMMEESIKIHHEMYRSLFKNHFTIKYHLMLHYGHIIRLVGPLRYSMTFKFEYKHQELKEYAFNCKCRKNLPYSICNKFCFRYALEKLLKKKLAEDVTEIKAQDKSHLFWSASKENFETVSGLRYKGTQYNVCDIVQSNNEFFIVRGLAYNQQDVLIYAEVVEVAYMPSLKSFCIKNSDTRRFKEIPIKDVSSNPVNFHKVNNKLYFVIKH